MERELRKEAIDRLAYGMDMPPEALKGLGSTNHWASMQILGDMWKSHGAPIAQACCEEMASAYLQPALRELGFEDWPNTVVAYDAAQVVVKPDRSEDAEQAAKLAMIESEGYRILKNIPEEYAPTEKERQELTRSPGSQHLPAGGTAQVEPTSVNGNGRDPSADGPPPPGPEGDSGAEDSRRHFVGCLIRGVGRGDDGARSLSRIGWDSTLAASEQLPGVLREGRRPAACTRPIMSVLGSWRSWIGSRCVLSEAEPTLSETCSSTGTTAASRLRRSAKWSSPSLRARCMTQTSSVAHGIRVAFGACARAGLLSRLMPWNVRKRGSRWCVIKVGETSPVPGGCHPTEAEARRHQRALYAGEASIIKEADMATHEPNPTPVWIPAYLNSGYVSGSSTSGVDLAEITWAPVNGDFAVAVVEKEDEVEEAADWEGILALEGLPTSDGRYLMPGKIEHRELPLTLMMQTVTDEGHKGAFAAGKITAIRKEERPDLGDGVVSIVGEGRFSNDEDGQRARELLGDEIVRHVSIDFSPTAQYMLDPETYEVIDPDSLDVMDLLMGGGEFVRGFEGDIMGATLLPFSAFEDATIQIVEVGEKVIVASSFPMKQVLTASAAGLAPLQPPRDFFFQPEPDGAFPLTVMPDGRVMGHLAVWDQCHRSMAHSCELAPRSKSKYAFFHTGAITCAEGEKVNVGRITVGEGGHASVSPYLGMQGAIDHYDKTGTVGAFVRAIDGKYGIWLSGVVRSDAPAEKVRDMEANPPSGDWREEKGRLELGAVLSVPVAGFPVPRYEAALVASGEEERVVALVASGYAEEYEFSRADQRQVETLKMKARRLLKS